MCPPLPDESGFFNVLWPRCKHWLFHISSVSYWRCKENKNVLFTQWDPSTKNLKYSNSQGSLFNAYLCRLHLQLKKLCKICGSTHVHRIDREWTISHALSYITPRRRSLLSGRISNCLRWHGFSKILKCKCRARIGLGIVISACIMLCRKT